MLSSEFKVHVTHLVSVLKRCDELCDAIFTTRRVGSKHESLDRLQLSLRSSKQAIQNEYTALRQVFGSRFDLGDEAARASLKSSIRTAEDIQQRLVDIASKRNDGLPGFRDMSRTVQRIEDSVTDTLATLGQNLNRPVPAPQAEKKPAKKEEKKPKKSELVVSIKEWDRCTGHLKNCWSESLVDGRILYVNAFDQTKNTFDMPRGGFIKTLPIAIPRPTTTQIPVYEQRRYRETSPIRRSSRMTDEEWWQWTRTNGRA